ncbi:MAG: SRPBCC family protein [Byssovorax sp.]
MLIEPIRVEPGGARVELRFPAPVARVFSTLSDLRTMETWWPEHRTYKLLRGDGGAGSLYGWTYRIFGLPLAGVTRVLTRDADERFTYRAGMPGVGILLDYRFAPDGDDARVSVTLRTVLARLPGFAGRLIPEMTRSYDKLEALVSRRPG